MPRSPSRRPLPSSEQTSAGGLVIDTAGGTARGALIARLDRRGRLAWSLPKGHIEPGESAEQAAVREVEEETGIRGRIVAALGSIDFWFVADRRRVHKTVHHFLLLAESGELSDADVEVAVVDWVGVDQLAGRLTYPDERQLLGQLPRLLADIA